MKKWQCSVCKYIHTGETPPDKCPVCGVSGNKFILLETGDDTGTKEKSSPKAIAQKPDSKIPDPPHTTLVIKPGEHGESVPIKVLGNSDARKSEAQKTENFYDKITGLMVKHHAHPVSVHMPNGILPAAVVLFILAGILDNSLFEKAGFINLVFVILALPLVLFSGVIEWKKKYNQAFTLIFKIKILAATLTTTACLVSVIWYLLDPLVLSSSKSLIFILVNIIMLASAGVAGHMGGKLVFKD
jgi:rubredoxin/uncharacterized membrane protein